jgi:hypothetical protein
MAANEPGNSVWRGVIHLNDAIVQRTVTMFTYLWAQLFFHLISTIQSTVVCSDTTAKLVVRGCVYCPHNRCENVWGCTNQRMLPAAETLPLA